MREHDFIELKFPIYFGVKKEREVNGQSTEVEPFVEQWRVFDVSTQTFLLPKNPFSKQVHLGLRIEGQSEIRGGASSTEPDPIRIYRALQILNRFDKFNPEPHFDLVVAYEAAGHNYPLSHHHFVRDKISGIIGEESLHEILQMIPTNLMAVIENLHKQRVIINGETLGRDIRRGLIESNLLYQRVISETGKRRKNAKRFYRNLWNGVAS